tara:strand:- start:671 stop:1321 length:651 start_codon:yes stop_codon:yes gene_type:complete
MLVFDDRNYFRVNLKRSVQLALIAKVKRFFSPKTRIPKNKYINIGCGLHRFEGFDNLDFYNSSFSFWKKKKYISHDFRYKLPFKDNSFEGAFSEHTLEHLYFNESKFLLQEICRIIKKSSIFRCTVPGLKIYIENYTEKKNDKYFSQFESGCDAVRDLVCSWGHLSVWDEITLKRELLKSGFSSVRVCEFGIGENKDLIKDLKERKHQTIYLEAKK